MALKTFAEFIDAIEALSVTGVTQQSLEGPPASMDTADLPYQYVRYPSGSESAIVLGEAGGLVEMRAQLVICVEAVAQNVQPENFEATVAIMDNVTTAIRAAGNCWPGNSGCRWSTRMAIDTVAGIDYWAVIVDIEGRG